MKLLVLTVAFPNAKGAEVFLGPEIKAIHALGHHVLIVPRSGRTSPTTVQYETQDTGNTIETAASPIISLEIMKGALLECLTRPGAVVGAARAVLGARAQAAVKNMIVLPKALWLARFARRNRVDHIHAHWAATTASIGLVASMLTGIPWSVTCHRGDIVANNLLDSKLRHASFVRFISRSSRRLTAELLAGEVPKHSRVLHMGVKLGARPIPHTVTPPSTILCPSALVPIKGHLHLLSAAAIMRDRGVGFLLEIAGDGPEETALRRATRRLGLERHVHFLGHLAHSQLLAKYDGNEVAVVVLASIDLGNGRHEGIPVALMEAMAAGVPVVSTRTGGIPELLSRGAGLLVPPADPQAMAKALTHVLKSESLSRRLSVAGRRRIARDFNVDRIAKTLVDHIKCCLPRNPTAGSSGGLMT